MAGSRKRSNGEGTLFWEERRRRWVAQLTLPDGERRKRTATTKKEAGQLLTRMAIDVETTGGVFDQSSRFSDLAKLWREKVLDAQVMAPSTRSGKDWALGHLEDELSRVKLVHLNADRIEGALAAMAAEGLGRESLIKVRSTANQVCKFGERRDLLRRNPVSVVELPAGLKESTVGRSLTVEQAHLLLAASKAHRLDVLWKVMLMLGLRPGEATGLHWEGIDFENDVLHVRHGLRKVDGAFEVTDQLKTRNSRRSLDMPKPLVVALRCHKEAQDSERLEAGGAWSKQWPGLVFTTVTGTPLDPSNLRRDFSYLTKSAGLGHWTPNELRHSCASILAASDVPLEHIGDVMGHDGTRMTWQVYRHVVTPSIGAAAGPMDELFG